jgi:membrane protein DedA with SNARE-associated domain
MEHAYFKLLHLLTINPGWAFVVVFLAASFESVALIGTFVPGSTAMFLAGALVGAGALNLGWVMVCAIIGAVAGDAASYWFGARYKATITQLWPFRSHPGLLVAGQKYFEMHGAKSVVFARFIAPLRAIIPVVAGMLGMRPARFLAVNIASALLWAPVHILPGVVFGASIELAGAVSFRLAVVVAIVVAAGWITFKLVRLGLSHAKAWTISSRRRVLNWADRKPGSRVRRLVLRFLNPANPVTGLIVTISVLLLVSGAVFFSTLRDVTQGNPVVQMDMSVYRFLQSFHSSWGDAVLSVVSLLGSLPTLTSLVVLVTVWMVFERRWHTVAYWLIAVVFSQLLVFSIQVAREGPQLTTFGPGIHTFPSDHVAATVVIYGFLAFLLVRRVGLLSGVLIATATVAILSAVALAGLYNGRFLFTDAVGGAALAAVWVFAVALTAVWRFPSKPVGRPLMPMAVLVVICASVAAQPGTGRRDQPAAVQTPSAIVVTPAQWTDTIWKLFSCYRSNMKGDRREPITIQWAATSTQITAQLLERGWTTGAPLSTRSVLSLVSPNVAAIDLPALPKLNNGEPSTLVFARAYDTADQRDVLRFWPTMYAVEQPGGLPPTPIWLGSVVHERLRRPSWPFNVLRPDERHNPMMLGNGNTMHLHDLQVARNEGCQGVPVTLIASKGE